MKKIQVKELTFSAASVTLMREGSEALSTSTSDIRVNWPSKYLQTVKLLLLSFQRPHTYGHPIRQASALEDMQKHLDCKELVLLVVTSALEDMQKHLRCKELVFLIVTSALKTSPLTIDMFAPTFLIKQKNVIHA